MTPRPHVQDGNSRSASPRHHRRDQQTAMAKRPRLHAPASPSACPPAIPALCTHPPSMPVYSQQVHSGLHTSSIKQAPDAAPTTGPVIIKCATADAHARVASTELPRAADYATMQQPILGTTPKPGAASKSDTVTKPVDLPQPAAASSGPEIPPEGCPDGPVTGICSESIDALSAAAADKAAGASGTFSGFAAHGEDVLPRSCHPSQTAHAMPSTPSRPKRKHSAVDSNAMPAAMPKSVSQPPDGAQNGPALHVGVQPQIHLAAPGVNIQVHQRLIVERITHYLPSGSSAQAQLKPESDYHTHSQLARHMRSGPDQQAHRHSIELQDLAERPTGTSTQAEQVSTPLCKPLKEHEHVAPQAPRLIINPALAIDTRSAGANKSLVEAQQGWHVVGPAELCTLHDFKPQQSLLNDQGRTITSWAGMKKGRPSSTMPLRASPLPKLILSAPQSLAPELLFQSPVAHALHQLDQTQAIEPSLQQAEQVRAAASRDEAAAANIGRLHNCDGVQELIYGTNTDVKAAAASTEGITSSSGSEPWLRAAPTHPMHPVGLPGWATQAGMAAMAEAADRMEGPFFEGDLVDNMNLKALVGSPQLLP